jgi:hypothetical protein
LYTPSGYIELRLKNLSPYTAIVPSHYDTIDYTVGS